MNSQTSIEAFTPQSNSLRPRYGIAIVHMQEYYLSLLEPIARRSFLEANRRVVTEAAHYNMPVTFLELENSDTRSKYYADNGPTSPALYAHLPPSPLRKVFRIECTDGFRHPEVTPWFKEHFVNTIVIGGLWASGCVISTADGAHDNFAVQILDDCIMNGERKLVKRDYARYLSSDAWRAEWKTLPREKQ